MVTNSRTGPLEGVRVVEMAGIGPGPYCGQLLADMGADVVVIDRPGGAIPFIQDRGKRKIVLDLRKDEAREVALKLIAGADVLIEGFRPGVMERMGLSPEVCHSVNRKLVFGRMTGWGQTGPWARVAGHDINYIAMTGALHAIGTSSDVPPPPLNLVGDYGGGSLFLLAGVLAALIRAKTTGEGDVVDAAIVDGVTSMLGMFYTFQLFGQWSNQRGSNMLDGGLPYYRCYETRDGKFMSVGCLEPQFFAIFLEKMDLSPETYGDRSDKAEFARQATLIAERFKTRTRDEWEAVFNGSDACVAPVLDLDEAKAHPVNVARRVHHQAGPVTHPGLAPRLASMSETAPSTEIEGKGASTRAVLSELGLSTGDIEALVAAGATVID